MGKLKRRVKSLAVKQQFAYEFARVNEQNLRGKIERLAEVVSALTIYLGVALDFQPERFIGKKLIVKKIKKTKKKGG